MEQPSPPPSAALRELKRQSDLLDAINRKLAPVQLLPLCCWPSSRCSVWASCWASPCTAQCLPES